MMSRADGGKTDQTKLRPSWPGQDVVVLGALEVSTLHRLLDIADELIPGLRHLNGSIWGGSQSHDGKILRYSLTLVQGVVGVRLQEEVLKADHDGVEVENGFPILSEDVQADISL